MPSGQWVFDPDSGGVKIKDAVKARIKKRLFTYAEANYAGRYVRLDIRFRGQFCYVDAYIEPEPPGPDWPPPDWPESREEYLERLRNSPVHLFRLRFFGREDDWGLAFFSYAHNKYELSVFPDGEFFGTPEVAFQTAAEFHLPARVVRPLQKILEAALEANATSVELEYVSEGLEVSFMRDDTGTGTVITEPDVIRSIIGDVIRDADLEEETEGKMSITLHGKERTILVEEWENFGESAFRLFFQ